MGVLLSFLSGILLALAFPKFNLSFLAWIALVPFFIALNQAKNGKEALLCGLAFGVAFFGIDLFWITSLSRFVAGWSYLGWILLTLYQTLFIFLFSLFSLFIIHYSLVMGIPIAWVAVEWLRAWGPWGVTSGVVGYTQAPLLPLIQIASFTSVYGITFLIVLANAALADVGTAFMAVRDKRKRINLIPTLLLILFLVFGCYAYGLWILGQASGIRHQASEVKLALIQPNIDQELKLDPKKVDHVFNIHKDLTLQATREKPAIIIWPETAVFAYLLQNQRFLPALKKLAQESQAQLIIGTPIYGEKGRAYNSVVVLSLTAEVLSRYDKEQLVPFGEYLPFRKILYPFLQKVGYFDAEFSSRPLRSLLSFNQTKIVPLICFESTFPSLVKKRSKLGGDFILTITNDAWFNNSSSPYYHWQTGVFRAIENRKYFVQVANTGISGVIDPYGRIMTQSKINERVILFAEIPLF